MILSKYCNEQVLKLLKEKQEKINIYLVGGTIRDLCLNIDNSSRLDLDFIIEIDKDNTTLKQQIENIFQSKVDMQNGNVGVFLDNNFTDNVETSYLVVDNIDDDLSRRDLTINALALMVNDLLLTNQSLTSEYIFNHIDLIKDNYNGLGRDGLNLFQNSEERVCILKTIHSNVFEDDPIRILRLFRFLGKMKNHYNDVLIDNNTIEQMKNSLHLLNQDISAERYFKEIEKVLKVGVNNPDSLDAINFFIYMQEFGVLKQIMPDLDKLFGVPQPEQHHPEIDSGIHSIMVLHQAIKHGLSEEEQWATLLHDLGKGVTPIELLPKHHGHEEAGVPIVEKVCDQFKVPKEWKQLAMAVCEHHLLVHKAQELSPKRLVQLFNDTDIWRKPDFFKKIVNCCQADALGRTGFENNPYPQKEYLLNMINYFHSEDYKNKLKEVVQSVEITAQEKEFDNKKKVEILKSKIHQLRVSSVKKFNYEWNNSNIIENESNSTMTQKTKNKIKI